MTKILYAKPIVQDIVSELKDKCQELNNKGIVPTLKVFLVGNHPPSLIYTRNKKRFIESFGGNCEIIHLEETISEEDFLTKFNEVAENPEVNGLFVQLPLPKHLEHIDVGQIVPAEKDVDGFHAQNIYRLMTGQDNGLISCTPKGIMTLLEKNNIDVAGKRAVVLGRSMIVGKPMQMLLTEANATVTLCHSRTENLKDITKDADIIISAIGKVNYLDSSFLRENQNVTIIDVGINHDENGKLCGDVDFDGVQNYCSAISPVPGGVGPLTIASLGQNLIRATLNQKP